MAASLSRTRATTHEISLNEECSREKEEDITVERRQALHTGKAIIYGAGLAISWLISYGLIIRVLANVYYIPHGT